MLPCPPFKDKQQSIGVNFAAPSLRGDTHLAFTVKPCYFEFLGTRISFRTAGVLNYQFFSLTMIQEALKLNSASGMTFLHCAKFGKRASIGKVMERSPLQDLSWCWVR